MPKLPVVKAPKLIKVLKKKNFILQRVHGSHHIFVRIEDKLTVSVPIHQGRDLGRGITLAILKDAISLVKKFYNIDIDLEKIPLDDKKTFTLLASGQTEGLLGSDLELRELQRSGRIGSRLHRSHRSG